ncbi:imm11 family protein [Sinorhizobium chiapasense]|uniref:Immunity MXAN-0049 protein domain-containing protein n=1 Tax=Sinorhizobium chiapasense TaxID=501572 RepID=A0ABZ2BJL2_9HYPH
MNKSDGVWVSVAPASTESVVALEADILRVNNAFALDSIRRNRAGEPLSAAHFPKQINIDPNTDHPDVFTKTRHLFHGDHWYVSAACASVLQSCDLGNGALYPVDFRQMDRKTPVPGQYYALNFGNTKTAFVPSSSKNVRENPYSKGFYQLYPIAEDGDVVVNSAALCRADIWIDPSLSRAFFVSDRLATALRASGCDKPFKLRRCRVV